MTRSIWMSALICAAALLVEACGGGGSSPMPQPAPINTIGAAGGTVAGPNGSQVVIPAGALSQNTAIAIEASSAGAPAQPAGMQLASTVFAFTPHGTSFASPATVSFPFDPTRVPAGVTPSVYKTNAAQTQWERVANASLSGTTASVQVTSFSWFAVAAVPPQITLQPADVTVVEGGNDATFTVTASGVAPLTYQWQRSTDNGPFQNITAAVEANYRVVGATVAADNGARFRVTVSSPEGILTSAAALLTVTTSAVVAPSITTEVLDQSAVLGGAATFSVVASGTALQFQWARAAPSSTTFADIQNANSASFTATGIEGHDNGTRFQVRVFNTAGSVTSRAATLRVVDALPVTGARIGAGGAAYSVARLATGALVSWGSDTANQLGAGAGRQDRSVPGSVLSIDNAVSVAVGPAHTLVLTSIDDAWSWNVDTFDRLGGNLGTVPERIPGVANATAACAGFAHSLFMLDDGTVLAVGDNTFGQLGNGTIGGSARTTPAPVLDLQGVAAISCGWEYSLALTTDGRVHAWGRNDNGQLGDGTTTDRELQFEVPGLAGVTAIAAAHWHSLVLRNDGSVWAWGLGRLDGRLGTGTETDHLTPTPTLASSGFIAIAAGGETSMALHSDGTVFVWGGNRVGQRGDGTQSDGNFTPSRVPGLTDVVAIAAPKVDSGNQSHHLFAVRANGTVMGWGQNIAGQIGNGQIGNVVTTPQPVNGLNLN